MRRRLWIAGALVLLGLAIWVLRSIDDEPAPPAASAAYPDHLRPKETERLALRREPVLLPSPAPAAPRRDPVLAALPVSPGNPVMVFEVNALRHSPVGQLLIGCMSARDRAQLAVFHQQTGIDPFADVDRLAVGDKGLLLSGFFGGHAPWAAGGASADQPPEPLGDHGALHALPDEAGVAQGVATWGDHLALWGARTDLSTAVDRIEGRAQPPDVLTEGDTYGDAYGVLPAEVVARLIPDPDHTLQARFVEAAQTVKVHLDAREDVAVSLEVSGPNTRNLDDLQNLLQSALTLGRLGVDARDQPEVAAVLAQAAIAKTTAGFTVDLVLPLPVVRRALGPCAAADAGQ